MAATAGKRDELVSRITNHLASGGLFNPELAIHDRVTALLIECRDFIAVQPAGAATAGEREWPPCPFCKVAGLRSQYSSVGTTLYCENGCHGEFTFPAFENEVLEMWQRKAKPTSGKQEQGKWHPCEHCKQFGKSVKILDAKSYSVVEAKDWDSAVGICEAHNASITTALDAAMSKLAAEVQTTVTNSFKKRIALEVAAAQQPLVKDLETLIKVLNTGSWTGTRTSISDIERRLAKVKEGKS